MFPVCRWDGEGKFERPYSWEEVFSTLWSAMPIKVDFSFHDGLSLALHNFRIKKNKYENSLRDF